jgi:hypothetical protein
MMRFDKANLTCLALIFLASVFYLSRLHSGVCEKNDRQ